MTGFTNPSYHGSFDYETAIQHSRLFIDISLTKTVPIYALNIVKLEKKFFLSFSESVIPLIVVIFTTFQDPRQQNN